LPSNRAEGEQIGLGTAIHAIPDQDIPVSLGMLKIKVGRTSSGGMRDLGGFDAAGSFFTPEVD
jgi:hypothetical protein